MTNPQADIPEAPKNSDRRIFKVLLENIHPDPKQPRLHPDDELAASIKSQGILYPFTVEPLQILDDVCPDCGLTFAELYAITGQYMINDGERRWRGAIAAGLKEVDVEIVGVTSSGKRLLRQVTSNTGKPLTAVEQALAYKSIMEEEGWNQAELARQLGIPRSVVGDRIRLVELDEVWLEAISAGKLQVSHAPHLSTFSAVPSEYQKKAAARLFEDYRAKRYLEGGGSIPIDELPRLLYVVFRDYIKEVGRTPGYHGPTVEIKPNQYSGKKKYAADIKLWRPCFKKWESKNRKAMKANAGGSSHRERRDVTLDKLETIEKRKSGEYYPSAQKGEVKVYVTDEGWSTDLRGDPDTFLRETDPAKLTRVYGTYGSAIVTSDLAAVAAARTAFDVALQRQLDSTLVAIRTFLRNQSGPSGGDYRIEGPGCSAVVKMAAKQYNTPLPVIAMALGISGMPIALGHRDENRGKVPELTPNEAASLATGLVAADAGALKIPSPDQLAGAFWNKIRRTPFKLAPRSPEGQAIESKKAMKKRLRAEGKKVGDPSRAPKLPKVGRAPDGSVTLSTPREEVLA